MNRQIQAINPPRLVKLGFLTDKSTEDRRLQGLMPQVIANLCVSNYVNQNNINFDNCDVDIGPLSLPSDDTTGYLV